VRDDRRTVATPRAVALVVTEIQALESLSAATAASSPDLPQLLRRLAEDYVELEAAAARSPSAPRARQKAEDDYTKLATQFPAYPHLDEVDYYLGLEYERDGRLDQTRLYDFKLIQSYPQSRYVPLAYLAFGDLFFDEARADPTKWELAKQAYQKVVGYPPPENRAYGYAWYRLGFVLWNQGDPPSARAAFTRASSFASAFPQLPVSTLLAAASSAAMTALGTACPEGAP
jgi:tetratricopeptide (TPR) repeat protein